MNVQKIKKIPGMTYPWMIASQIKARINARKLREEAPAPKLLMLESSSRCNLGCAKCPRNASSTSYGDMDVGMGLNLIKQAASIGVQTVSLSMIGEPLLHPELERLVEAARAGNMYVYMVTNATMLTPQRAESLIKAGVNDLKVSIDGWDKDSYNRRQSGSDLELVLDNLKNFRRIRSNVSPQPPLIAVITFDKESLNHLSEIKYSLAPYVDMFALNPLTDFGIPNHRIEPSLLPGKRSWKRTPCSYFWHTINIRWNGLVTACCNDSSDSLVYHNANEAPLEKIWRSESIKKFRRLHIKGRFNQMPLCGSCTRDWVNSFAFRRISHKFNSIGVSENAATDYHK